MQRRHRRAHRRIWLLLPVALFGASGEPGGLLQRGGIEVLQLGTPPGWLLEALAPDA